VCEAPRHHAFEKSRRRSARALRFVSRGLFVFGLPGRCAGVRRGRSGGGRQRRSDLRAVSYNPAWFPAAFPRPTRRPCSKHSGGGHGVGHVIGEPRSNFAWAEASSLGRRRTRKRRASFWRGGVRARKPSMMAIRPLPLAKVPGLFRGVVGARKPRARPHTTAGPGPKSCPARRLGNHYRRHKKVFTPVNTSGERNGVPAADPSAARDGRRT